jgi:two-component system, chemotaxis family, protein-glutamate methylesterase/glutaminase
MKSCEPPRMVIVVASAGGLPAIRTVLGGLPAEFPLPVVVQQHLSAGGDRVLTALLTGRTRLPVRPAESGHAARPGHIYVAPAKRHLLIRADGRLALSDQPPVRHNRPSADTLLASAADAIGTGTIAVVLTGAGRDGARGVTAVGAAGGTVVVQDPRTAFCGGMPAAAVATGYADHVVPADLIAALLVRLAEPVAEPIPVSAAGR